MAIPKNQIQISQNKTREREIMAPKLHAIMVSLPYQGHITPFVNLAIKLASKGFIITFAHLEFVDLHMRSKSHKSSKSETDLFFSEARESGFDIRYTTISDGFPLEFDRVRNAQEYWVTVDRDFPGLAADFIKKTMAADSDPGVAHFLITDTMFTWGPSVAKKLNLIYVSFWTEPALVFSLAYHMDLLKQNGHFPCKENVVEEVDYLPGVEPISTKDFLTHFKEAEVDSLLQKATIVAFEEVKKSDFILHNTVQELESGTLSALNKYQPNYAIGPINFTKDILGGTNSSAVSSSLWLESDCTNWLDSKPPGSVLYVSFGSLLEINKQLLEEIAYGLLLSDVNFIWVVRDNADALPVGFKDETKSRGLIIPWCNQITVLSHPAVGGFVTHNGWNSTLESIWFGAPMICYPMNFDQPVNRKLVVDDWKVGINLCDHGTSVDRKVVAEKINNLFSGTVAKSLRQEVKEVNAILQNSIRINGSSERNLDRFIKDLEAKIIDATTTLNRTFTNVTSELAIK